MKVVIAFAFLIVGISAHTLSSEIKQAAPSSERIISDAVISALEDASQSIKDAGLDPLIVKKETFTYTLPVPVIFNALADVEEVLSTGLSEIIVNSMSFSILASRLDFVIELPHIHLSADSAIGEATLFGNKLRVECDGRLDVRRIRIVGAVRVNIGIISGISLRDVRIDLNVGSINSNMRLAVQGINYSEQINTFISSTIPRTLRDFSAEINELIEIIMFDIISDLL